MVSTAVVSFNISCCCPFIVARSLKFNWNAHTASALVLFWSATEEPLNFPMRSNWNLIAFLLFITSYLFVRLVSFAQFWGAEKETQQRLETAIFEDLNRYCWTASAPPTTNGSVTDTQNTVSDNDNSGSSVNNNNNGNANSSTSLGPPVINNSDGQVVYLFLYIFFFSSPLFPSLLPHRPWCPLCLFSRIART